MEFGGTPSPTPLRVKVGEGISENEGTIQKPPKNPSPCGFLSGHPQSVRLTPSPRPPGIRRPISNATDCSPRPETERSEAELSGSFESRRQWSPPGCGHQNYTIGGANRRFWSMLPLTRVQFSICPLTRTSHFGAVSLSHCHHGSTFEGGGFSDLCSTGARHRAAIWLGFTGTCRSLAGSAVFFKAGQLPCGFFLVCVGGGLDLQHQRPTTAH